MSFPYGRSLLALGATAAYDYYNRPAKRPRLVGDAYLNRIDRNILAKTRPYVPYSPYFMRTPGWRPGGFGRRRYRRFRRYRRRW